MILKLFIAGSLPVQLPAFIIILFFNYNIIKISSIDETKLYALILLKNNSSFSIEWVHSVDKLPWKETFKISDNTSFITLIKSSFKSFGAGVPSDIPDSSIYIKDGWINYNINIHMNEISYNISKDDYKLHIGDKVYKMTDLIDGKKAVKFTPVKLMFR